MTNLIWLDTETNCANEKALIQFAAIKREAMGSSLDSSFIEKQQNFLIKTDKEIKLEALEVHHITKETLEKSGVSLESVKPEIDNFLKNSILIAHNYDFDKKVLEINGIDIQTNAWIDTYTVAYMVLTRSEMKHRLQYLRYYFDCKFINPINPHDALSDVIVLKAVFFKLCEEVKKFYGIPQGEVIDKMVEVTKQGILLREFAFGKYKGWEISKIAQSDRLYCEWLLNDNLNKPAEEQNKHMINTLKYYLKKDNS